jgi:glyoxylase-like metal-dependent hydrolase (beta-lactamase superfamily II)
MNPVCVTCGTQFPESPQPPEHCPICDDERQFVGFHGQQWTTLEDLRKNYRNLIRDEEPELHSIYTEPNFAIGQRAFLIETPEGNLLWDCITLLDNATRAFVGERGGLRAIAISHPHYYSAMVEWSRTFGNIPIYLHEADRQWAMRPDPVIEFWSGETKPLFGGLALFRCGGHFPGGTVLHWPAGATGKGALLTGDVIQVVPDRRWVSFMYSYPNYIPLNAAAVRRILDVVRPLPFDCIYGAFPGRTVFTDAKAAIDRSAARYIRRLR